MAFRKSLLGEPAQVGSKLFSTKKVENDDKKTAKSDIICDSSKERSKEEEENQHQ